MLGKVGRLLYRVFAYPFVWLFLWLRMKWAWRGFAIVTQEDWDRVVRKTADRYGESLFPESVSGDPREIMIDGKPADVEFWAKQKVMKVLRNDPAFKEARQYLTKAVWPNVPGWGQSAQRPHISAEEAQAIISGTGKCDNGDNPE